MCKREEGFTLIELMVVVVIISILAAIAIPNFMRIVTQAKVAEVEANMHTTQLEVEYYCIETGGHLYPSSINDISDELPPNMRNPFRPNERAVQDKAGEDVEGVVEYDTESPNDSYTITGLGKDKIPINLTLSPGRVD
jgi:prepilin-type N-terminal cleavage/methylation domain-containing protein